MAMVKRLRNLSEWRRLLDRTQGFYLPFEPSFRSIQNYEFFESFFDFDHQPFFRRGFATAFVRQRADTESSSEGWIFLSIDEGHFQKTGERIGHCSWLALHPELANNDGRRSEVLRTLFRAAQDWGELRGVRRWVGPILFTPEWGFTGTVTQDQSVPGILRKNIGYQLSFDVQKAIQTWTSDPSLLGAIERSRSSGYLQVKSLAEMGEIPQELWSILYRERFSSGMSATEFDFLMQNWKGSLDPQLTLLLEVSGESAGAVLVGRRTEKVFIEGKRSLGRQLRGRLPFARKMRDLEIYDWVETDASRAFGGRAFLLYSLCEKAARLRGYRVFLRQGLEWTQERLSDYADETNWGQFLNPIGPHVEPIQLWSF